MDPEDLFPQDRGLLDEDFGDLGSSPAAGATWIEATETAMYPLLNTLADQTLTNFSS